MVLRAAADSPAWPTSTDGRWRRVVIEKPFGHDLKQRRELNATGQQVFPEESVFRIDHYLGKETVQNILALRFANELYEPIWNSNYVDHVQITMAEDIGVGGRAGYYDGIGAARDVIQNHLLQLLALTAMEEPVTFDPQSFRREKIKVLSATQLRAAGSDAPRAVSTPRAGRAARRSSATSKRTGFSKDSTTETYAAIKLEIDTRRWAGVPFYLRTGKRLGRGSPRSPWSSSAPRTCRSTQTTPRNSARTRWSSGCSPTKASPSRFGSKVPGPRNGGPGRQHGLLLRLSRSPRPPRRPTNG